MRALRVLGRCVALLLVAAGVAAPVASADPPPNDDRANATPVEAPGSAEGTTAESTPEENGSGCDDAPGSVWYRLTAPRTGRLIVQLHANGDLDAVVDVFRVRRSELSGLECDATDRRGDASVAVSVSRNQSYLIRVARQADSVDGTFRLSLQYGRPPASPPGSPLPPRGATGTLQRVVDPSVAYNVRLRAGVTYRFNLATGSCTPLSLYPPGTTSFARRPVDRANCGGYMLFTPEAGESGRYILLAEASSARRAVRYRLMSARARRDDTSPGRFIRNYARVRGRLDATRIDVLDLYRFDVTRRSDLELGLETDQNFSVTLLTAGGKRLGRGSDGGLTRRLKPGRYFAAVRAGRGARGSYRLTRVSRAITRTRALVEGRRRATLPPGATASLSARITPGVPGPVVIIVERFDPVDGWQFSRRFRVRSGSGTATVGYNPPGVGRYRFRAEFLGTRGASPSRSGIAFFRVQGPLQE
jgi:hypothetical protein